MKVISMINNEDCLKTMARMKEGSIDLTVTSPPYDNLRMYKGYTFDFEAIAKELFRVTKPGGVVVWIVGDATVKGSETGTSFKQALFFKECGFNLHDTMIYLKNFLAFPDSNRYFNAFEYMFVFTKGGPKTFNPIKDRKNASAGRDVNGKDRTKEGGFKKRACAGNTIKEFGVRWNYWLIPNQTRGEHTKGHPATFPEKLAEDHILSWSNPKDLIYDPMCGSGTTGKMALKHGRKFIGSEIAKEYCEICKARLEGYLNAKKQSRFKSDKI